MQAQQILRPGDPPDPDPDPDPSPTPCVPNRSTQTDGWPRNGDPVTYNVNNLPSNVRGAAREAFARWTTANQTNGSGVRFVEATQGTININPNGATGEVGNAIVTNATNTRTAASATINLSLSNNNNFNILGENYYESVREIMMHEIGHTMGLGNRDADGSSSYCNGQSPGRSVMNYFCGVNNQEGGTASNITRCDNASVRRNYTTPTPTPTPVPTPTPTPIECLSNLECEECPCGDCVNGCEPPEPTCEWYYPPMECVTTCEIDDYGHPINCETDCYQPPPVYICY